MRGNRGLKLSSSSPNAVIESKTSSFSLLHGLILLLVYSPIRYCYCDLRRCRSITIPVAPPLSSALPGSYRPCGLAEDVNAVGIAIFGALCGPVLRRVMPVRAWTGPVVWIRAFASRPSAMCIIRAMACRRGSSWCGIRSRCGWMFLGRVCHAHLSPVGVRRG